MNTRSGVLFFDKCKTYPRHCERSEAIQSRKKELDCFVASLLAMTEQGDYPPSAPCVFTYSA
jgi:hypothetical protein